MEILSGYLFFAFLAAIFWALGNVLDKTVLTYHLEDPVTVTFYTMIFTAVFALPLPLIGLIDLPSSFILVATLAAGALYFLPVYFYMKGLSIEEVSRVTPVMDLTPIFTAILGALFIGEVFEPVTYAGIVVAISGAVIFSSQRFGKEFFQLQANKAFWLVLIGASLFAAYAVLTKWLLGHIDFWNVFFWSRIGSVLPLSLFLLRRQDRLKVAEVAFSFQEKKAHYLGVSEMLNYFGLLTQTIAISLGPVAIVKTATAIQPLMVLFAVVALKKIWDHELEEDFSRAVLLKKIVAGLLIIAGIFLTQL